MLVVVVGAIVRVFEDWECGVLESLPLSIAVALQHHVDLGEGVKIHFNLVVCWCAQGGIGMDW